MGGMFSIMGILVRSLFLLLAGASVVVLTAASAGAHGGQLVDPFAPYAYLRLAEPPDGFVRQGFVCKAQVVPTFATTCSLKPSFGTFSEIGVSILYGGQRSRQVIYRPRANTLTIGDLVLLWGKPEIRTHPDYIALRWPSIQTSAMAIIGGEQHFSYFLPLSSITIRYSS